MSWFRFQRMPAPGSWSLQIYAREEPRILVYVWRLSVNWRWRGWARGYIRRGVYLGPLSIEVSRFDHVANAGILVASERNACAAVVRRLAERSRALGDFDQSAALSEAVDEIRARGMAGGRADA